MTSNINKPYTTTLPLNMIGRLVETRQQFLEVLNGIIMLVASISKSLEQIDSIGTLNDTQTIIHDLNCIYSNVKHLELRMCIVAPMKAGKSTVINAILGQDILPTRNAAMTVIPTEVMLRVVKLDGIREEPILIMDKELIEQIIVMQQEVRLNLATSQDLEDLKRKLPEHTHLVSVAEEIRDAIDGNRIFEETTTGAQHIRTTLQYVNDVIRLHEILIPAESSGSSRRLFKKLPRIIAPYISIGDESEVHESLGNLVIVDTPGPNEDTYTNFLKEIVIRELKRATVILVVLDYTALNTEADKIVKTEIMNIRQASSSGDDSLFALVNKVDRRRRGDMSSQQVYDLVRNKFGIGQGSSDQQRTKQMFEVQALRALLAKQLLMDVSSMDLNQQLRIEDLKSGPDFLVEAYGAAYDEDDPPTIDKAKRDAIRLWQKSGFESFLVGSIEKLIERAAPRAIESALNHCQSCLYRLHENLTLRERLLGADEEALRLQIDALSADIQKLSNVMDEQRIYLTREQIRLITHFQARFLETKDQALKQLTRVLNEHFRVDELHQTDYTDVNSGMITSNASPTFFMRSPIHYIMWQIAAVLGNRALSGGILSFENEVQGHAFIRNVERQIYAIPDDALVTIRADVDTECDLACLRLNEHLKNNTKEILTAVQNRLADAFDIQFRKPPNFEPVYLTSTDLELEFEKSYRPWWLFDLISIPHGEGHTEGATYQIRINDLKTRFINLLGIHLDAIETELNIYLSDVLQDNFARHFEELNDYLTRYRDYVNKSLNDQARTMDEKAVFKVLLVEVAKQIDDRIQMVADMHEFFESHASSTSVEVE
jgi:predicted GTPase